MAGLQDPELPPVTLLHVTVTADTGTVAQFVNELVVACTCKFQVLLFDPVAVVQLTVEAELPEMPPRSGSAATKLMVLGVAETAPTVAAANIGPAVPTNTRDFCWDAIFGPDFCWAISS
jgi:hypothetical protein